MSMIQTHPNCFRFTNLNLKLGRKLLRIEERHPSAAMSKLQSISIVSPDWRTLVLTLTEVLSSELQKERNKWPHKKKSGGSALYRRLWRSAQCAALKLKLSSLVSARLIFSSPYVAWFCNKTWKKISKKSLLLILRWRKSSRCIWWCNTVIIMSKIKGVAIGTPN